jgi:hemin uptake protein HemP
MPGSKCGGREVVEKSDSEERRGMMRPETSGDSGGGDVEVFDSRALFGDRKEIGIRHEGQIYRLRKTRHGKLILNK